MTQLLIRPVTATIGAEVEGVDLRRPLEPAEVEALLTALVRHHVLFFRDQDITPEQQVAFAKQFGPISFPPFAPKYGTNPEFIVLDQTHPRGEGGARRRQWQREEAASEA